MIAEVADVLSAIRKVKSEAKVSMRAEVAHAEVLRPAGTAARVSSARSDISAAGRIADLQIGEGEPSTQIDLAGPTA